MESGLQDLGNGAYIPPEHGNLFQWSVYLVPFATLIAGARWNVGPLRAFGQIHQSRFASLFNDRCNKQIGSEHETIFDRPRERISRKINKKRSHDRHP